MAAFHDIRSFLGRVEGFQCSWLLWLDQWEIWYEHRNIKYPSERISADYQIDLEYLLNILAKMVKEIDYYLDAIWC